MHAMLARKPDIANGLPSGDEVDYDRK